MESRFLLIEASETLFSPADELTHCRLKLVDQFALAFPDCALCDEIEDLQTGQRWLAQRDGTHPLILQHLGHPGQILRPVPQEMLSFEDLTLD